MAITKKTIRHIQVNDPVESTLIRLADLDIEYNLRRIETAVKGTLSQEKASIDGDSGEEFEAASPTEDFEAVTWVYAEANFGQGSKTTLNNHEADTTNPHSVTKTQVGLGNVTNDKQALPSDMASHEALEIADGVHGFVTGANLVEGTAEDERIINQDLIEHFDNHQWTAKVHDDLIVIAFEYNGSVAYSLFYPFAIDYYKGTDMLVGPQSGYSIAFEYVRQSNGTHFVHDDKTMVVDMANFDDLGWNTMNLGSGFDTNLTPVSIAVSKSYGHRYIGTDMDADGSRLYKYDPTNDTNPEILDYNNTLGIDEFSSSPVQKISANDKNEVWLLFKNDLALYKINSGFTVDTSKVITGFTECRDLYVTRDDESFVAVDSTIKGFDSGLNEIVSFTTAIANYGVRVDSFGYIYALQQSSGTVYVAKYDRSGNKLWEYSKGYNLTYTFDMNSVGYFYLITDDDMTVLSPEGNVVDQFIGIYANGIVDGTGITSDYKIKRVQVETST